MFTKQNIGIALIAIASFLFGWMYYNNRQKKKNEIDSDLNKTLVFTKDGRYYIVFNSVVVLSREITKQQYDDFKSKYSSGKAQGNLIDKFSTPPPKYTKEGNKYFEYIWNGSGYDNGVEITKSEYDFETRKNAIPDFQLANF